MQSSVSSYSADNAFKKIEESGIILCTPKLPNLELPNFNGKPSEWAVLDEEKMQYPMQLFSPKTHLFVTSAKIINNRIDRSKLHLWKTTPQGDHIIKTIDHNAFISLLSFSPDQKWLATSSCDLHSRQNSKLMLTQTDPLSDQYLSDVMVIPEWNSNQKYCFNKASTLLVYTQEQKLKFFSLQKQETICSLELPKDIVSPIHTDTPMKYSPRLIELGFNHDDTRLIAYLADGRHENNNSTFIIWDISDINNPKELQLMHIPIKRSNTDVKITFNYPEKNIAAISTNYTTFFFDVKTGNFLSKTEDVINQENAIFAAACSIPFSPIFYIAKNIDDKTSCVNLYSSTSGKCEGIIVFNQPSIDAIGITKNARSLVSTFQGFKSIITEVLSEEKDNPITVLVNNAGLVTFYGLLQLYKAKKDNKKAYISPVLLEYMQNFSEGKSYKDIVDRYLL
jgi:WD40 repeat protein